MLENMQDNAAVGERKAAKVRKARAAEARRAPSAASAHSEQSQARRRGGSVSADLSRFDYTPSAGVSREVNAGFAGVLSGSGQSARAQATARALSATLSRHPRFRSLLAAQLGGRHEMILAGLESGVLQKRFSERLEKFGYSATNAIDVNNAYLLHAWSIVNDAKVDGSAYAAQRSKSAAALSAGRGTAATSGAEKQEFSETMGLLLMLSAAAWNRTADPADRAALQAGSADMAQRLGMDLRGATLTRDGITSR